MDGIHKAVDNRRPLYGRLKKEKPISLNGRDKTVPFCLFQNHMNIFRHSVRLKRSTLPALLITWYSLRMRGTVE